MRFRWIVFALVLTASCSHESDSSTSSLLALVNADVVDGTGAPTMADQVVLVDGPTIVAVGNASEVQIPTNARILDLQSNWLVPGFIDLHVHFPEEPSAHDAILARLLEFGITTILNPGARPGAGVDLRERIAAQEVEGPRMFTAGRLIDHSPDERFIGGWAAQTPSDSTVRAEVRQQTASGVDFIKLYAGLTPDLVAAAIAESHEAGLPVIGHLETTNWGDAARMGIDMLVHSGWATPMDEIIVLDDSTTASDYDWYAAYLESPSGAPFAELVSVLKTQGVIVVPTIAVQQASALGNDLALLERLQPHLAPEADVPGWWGEGWRDQHPYFGYESEDEARALETIYVPALLAILKAYYDAGVTLAVGTDVGNPWMTPGVSFHHELELYQEAGIPAVEILRMATLGGAAALGIDDQTGSIEEGKQADLVVLSADPTQDIRASRTIAQVFMRGRQVIH